MPEYKGKTGSTAWYEYMMDSGLAEWLNEKDIVIMPTHNAKLISEAFERDFEKHLAFFTEDNQRNGLPLDDFAYLHLRLNWLHDYVLVKVDGWLSKTDNNGKPKHPVQLREADIIERKRYRMEVVAETMELEKRIEIAGVFPVTVNMVTNHPATETSKIEYKSFADLFINSEDVIPCIDALRKFDIDKPVLGIELNWLGGKRKGIIVGWIERMEQLNKIRKVDNRRQLVVLLNSYFENLDMGKDARVFGGLVSAPIQDAFKALMPK